MKEIWKIYPKNTKYSVSNLGRVKNIKKDSILNGWVKGSGYINTYAGLIHRMVLETFVGDYPSDKPYTNHINGIKTDNRLENLEYTNHTLNALHAHKNGLIKQSTPIEVYEYKTNKFVGKFYSIGDACRHLGIAINNMGNPNVTKALNGKLKHSYGFTFKRCIDPE